MTDLIKIAVDAMGGDGSPQKVIDGIIYNHKSNHENFFQIFGDKEKINDCINNQIDKNFYTNCKFFADNLHLSPVGIKKIKFLFLNN